MIEATAIPNRQQSAEPNAQKPEARPESRNDIAAGFSFPAAMTALEGRASQSLKTFGAAPQNGVTNPSNTSEKSPSTPQPANGDAQQTERAPTETSAKSSPRDTQITDKSATPAPAPDSRPTANAATAAAVIAANTAAAPLQQITSAATRQESGAVREASLARQAAIKAPRAAAAQAPQPATQDFAQLLARRLGNGATSFELRLDPPGLGRVEAHVKLGGDGESILALKFENQTALDHFARDEADLRNALFSSGFEFDGDRLSFSLKEDAPARPGADALAATETYDPIFIAPFSNGVVDLRI